MFLLRWITYIFERFTGVVTIVCVVIIFGIILQLVTSCRQDFGLAPKPTAQPAAVAPQGGTPPPGPLTNQPATGPATTTTNPSPAPVVPRGPSPADIRSQLQSARDRLVESNVHVDSALQSITDWNSEIPPLLKTAAGDNIAAHEDLVDSLNKIVNAKRTPESTLKVRAKRIATFRSELGKRTTSSTPKPLSSQEEGEIDELEALASTADDEWSKALSNARAVKVLGDARVDPDKKRSLEDAIKLKAAEDRLAALEEQLKQEKARKAQEAADKREQEKLDAEREREKERLAAKRKEEAEAAAEKKRLEKEALLARARSSEVQSTLAIFLHKRDVQPQKVGPGSVNFRSTFDAAPMSLSALKGIGALEPTTEGLKWLARVGGNRKLSSPRWGVASQPGNWSEDDKKLLKEAQELLRALGPTLVEAKLLSP